MNDAIVHHIPDVAVRYDLLLPHPGQPLVAVIRGQDGFELPWITPQEHHTAIVNHIHDLLLAKYGVEAVAVRILRYQHEREQAAHFRLYQLANWTDLVQLPAGFAWVGEEELDELVLAHEAYRPVLKTWFAEASGRLPIPVERVPWARPGWYRRIRQWITTTLMNKGWQLGEIALYRAWGISAGLWVKTDQGRVYVKAPPPQFGREAAVTRFLAAHAPTRFPNVVATDEDEGWLMMLASPAGPLLAQADPANWRAALVEYGRQQRASRAWQVALQERGCVDRGLDALADEAEQLLAEAHWLRPEPSVAFADEELARFRTVLPELQQRCRYYARHGLASTIIHGDFHPGNILSDAAGPLFIDWSDACWGHPFMDLVIFLLEDFGNPPLVNEQTEQIVTAYLAGWTAENSLAELRAEFEALRPVAYLFHALTYARIVDNLEPSARWEMHNVVPWIVRQVWSGQNPLMLYNR